MVYNQSFSVALMMMELGCVERDVGPKSIEEGTISFFQEAFVNGTTPLKDVFNAEQFIKNFATYAVMLTLDSPTVSTTGTTYICPPQRRGRIPISL